MRPPETVTRSAVPRDCTRIATSLGTQSARWPPFTRTVAKTSWAGGGLVDKDDRVRWAGSWPVKVARGELDRQGRQVELGSQLADDGGRGVDPPRARVGDHAEIRDLRSREIGVDGLGIEVEVELVEWHPGQRHVPRTPAAGEDLRA